MQRLHRQRRTVLLAQWQPPQFVLDSFGRKPKGFTDALALDHLSHDTARRDRGRTTKGQETTSHDAASFQVQVQDEVVALAWLAGRAEGVGSRQFAHVARVMEMVEDALAVQCSTPPTVDGIIVTTPAGLSTAPLPLKARVAALG